MIVPSELTSIDAKTASAAACADAAPGADAAASIAGPSFATHSARSASVAAVKSYVRPGQTSANLSFDEVVSRRAVASAITPCGDGDDSVLKYESALLSRTQKRDWKLPRTPPDFFLR